MTLSVFCELRIYGIKMSTQVDTKIEARPKEKYLCQAGMDHYHCNNTIQFSKFTFRKHVKIFH